MTGRRDRLVTAIAGALLLGAPATHVLFGGAFGIVHAVVGMLGFALLVATLPDRRPHA